MRSFINFILATVFTAALHAQETIGTAKFWAEYKFSYKTRPEQPNFDWVDWMYLDIGDKVTKFYNRYAEMKDSAMNEGLKKGLSAWELHELTMQYPVRGAAPVYYQLYNQRKTRVAVEYIANGYVYEEPMKMPEWKIDNKALVLHGYNCRRATTHYLGRNWEVYYAPDIPFSYGPWKLWGLPGLIVRATDADHYFLFELDIFEPIKNEVPIIYIHRRLGNRGGYNGAEYKRVSKSTYIEYERSYHKDAITFFGFETGSEIKDSEGNPLPVSKMDYIPLEK